MPAYKTPSQFPGVSVLPGPVRGLVEGMFPANELPTPAMAAGKQVMPTARDVTEMIKRLRGGLAKAGPKPKVTPRYPHKADAALEALEEMYPTPELPSRLAGWEILKQKFGF